LLTAGWTGSELRDFADNCWRSYEKKGRYGAAALRKNGGVHMTWPETRQADIETFQSLDQPTRALILRMLARPTNDDREELRQHPNGEMLAAWLLRMPAYSGPRTDQAGTERQSLTHW
jgi:hypothetical protein